MHRTGWVKLFVTNKNIIPTELMFFILKNKSAFIFLNVTKTVIPEKEIS